MVVWPPPSPGCSWFTPGVGDSCLVLTQAVTRPAGLPLAPLGPPLHRHRTWTLVIVLGSCFTDLCLIWHCLVGPLIHVNAFRSIRWNRRPIHDSEALWVCYFASGLNTWHTPQGCQAGWPRIFRSAWVCAQFRLFLVHDHLKSKLIQNLWNLLELSKIWMEHSVKLILFPSSWRSKCEIMAVNIAM